MGTRAPTESPTLRVPGGRTSRERSGRTLGMVLTCAMSPPAAGQVTGSAESDTSRVRNKLRKFLQRRPTLQSLRERGYIKGGCQGGWIRSRCWHGAGSRIHAGMGCQDRAYQGWVLEWG